MEIFAQFIITILALYAFLYKTNTPTKVAPNKRSMGLKNANTSTFGHVNNNATKHYTNSTQSISKYLWSKCKSVISTHTLQPQIYIPQRFRTKNQLTFLHKTDCVKYQITFINRCAKKC